MKHVKIFSVAAFIFQLPILAFSGFNELPPYDEQISIQYCEKLFKSIEDRRYFNNVDSDHPLVGNYRHGFSIGWPQLEHIVQAAIIGERYKLYSAWWRSERRDTRILSSALLYCFEKIGVSSFYLPSPYRYNAAERLCRIEELAFVTKNLGYFYDKFIPIFEAALGKNHSLVTQLKNKPNLKSNYLKYDPRKEPLIEKYEN